MLIVDAQVHVWKDGRPAAHHRQTPFLPDELLREMDAAGVSRVVLVPPGWAVDGAALPLQAARDHPDRFAVMGRLSLTRPESRAAAPRWLETPGMLGLRLNLGRGEGSGWRNDDGSPGWIWAAAERAGVPLGIVANGVLPDIAPIVAAHPRLRVTICHLGVDAAGPRDAAAFSHLPDLLALARSPNVAVQASTVPATSSEAYPFRNVHEHLRTIFEAFGPRRFFWGTDFTRLQCRYRDCVTLFTEELPFLSGADLDLVMGRALCDWLDWRG